MQGKRWKVGELARATGLTVRTLHHYDELGLLAPAARSEAGHRLYGDADIQRLYRIRALRDLGFPLAEIEALVHGGGVDLRQALERQLERLDQRLALQERLRRRVAQMLERMDEAGAPTTDQLIETLEMMTMFERYYTPEQLAKLEERRQMLGDEAIHRAEQEWKDLIDAVEHERRQGTDPASARVQELAQHWQSLIEQFTGGDAGIRRSLQAMYESEGVQTASRGAVSPELMTYVQRAMAAGRQP